MRKPLDDHETRLIKKVLQKHPLVKRAVVFGSRAKGTHSDTADIDLSLWGDLEERSVEAVASDLDDLPLPYRFDLLHFSAIKSAELRGHIERVGVEIYRRS